MEINVNIISARHVGGGDYTQLNDFPDETRKAVENIIRHERNTVRTQIYSGIMSKYALRKTTVRKKEIVALPFRRNGDGFSASLHMAGNRLPLYNFNVLPALPEFKKGKQQLVKAKIQNQIRWIMTNPGVTPTAQIEKGKPFYLNPDRAFVAKMKSGHIGVFERDEGKYSMVEKRGLSLPVMAGQTINTDDIADKVIKDFDQRMKQAVGKILSGN